MYYFIADEHYGHHNIIKYCNRPFDSVEDMDEFMIDQNNKVVTSNDTVVHIGDFSLASRNYNIVEQRYIRRLNGKHIFIPGSHDYWIGTKTRSHIWQKSIDRQQIVCCHYAMLVWPASHWGSWHLFGHSHGKLEGVGKSFDDGADVHGFRPLSFEEIKEMMKNRSENPGMIKKEKRF